MCVRRVKFINKINNHIKYDSYDFEDGNTKPGIENNTVNYIDIMSIAAVTSI